MDFLQTHECELSIKNGYLFIDGMKIKLRRESATNTVARIKLVSDVTLPGRTELAVSGRAEHMSRKISSYYSCVEPSPMMRGMAKYGVMTGCAVVQTNADNIVVPLMNTGDDDKVILVMRCNARDVKSQHRNNNLRPARTRRRPGKKEYAFTPVL